MENKNNDIVKRFVEALHKKYHSKEFVEHLNKEGARIMSQLGKRFDNKS